jgi:hypothetical protein
LKTSLLSLGFISTGSTVAEIRMKSAVKTKVKKTNNQASFGGSHLKNSMKLETAMEMQLHLDETVCFSWKNVRV